MTSTKCVPVADLCSLITVLLSLDTLLAVVHEQFSHSPRLFLACYDYFGTGIIFILVLFSITLTEKKKVVDGVLATGSPDSV